jgi:diaminopimelate epimerase
MIVCTKMNGNGNDFLVINNMELKYSSEQLFQMAKKICRRREAVGADGLLIAEPSSKAEFKMRLINRDGSEGEMCGNGARCMARFAYETGIVKNDEMQFETLGGLVSASVHGNHAALKLSPVSVKDVPVDRPASVNGYDFNYTFLNVGVPHTVIFEDTHRTEDEYRKLGRDVRGMADLFPQGTNVNFAVPRAERDGGLDVVTFERGVEDLTLSCGTGSTASAIAAVLIGLTGPKVDVYNPGGMNRVSLTFQSSDVVLPELEGTMTRVAELQISDEALQ